MPGPEILHCILEMYPSVKNDVLTAENIMLSLRDQNVHTITRRYKRDELKYVKLLHTFQYNVSNDLISKVISLHDSWFCDRRKLAALVTYGYHYQIPHEHLHDLDSRHMRWNPRTHKYFPSSYRDQVFLVLLVFKRVMSQMPKDIRLVLLHKIFKYQKKKYPYYPIEFV